MTYLLTEEEHKAVREAVEIANSFTGGYSLDSPSRNTTNKALAILDKLQRVEVVAKVGSHWNSGGGFDVYDFSAQPAYKTPLYSVKD